MSSLSLPRELVSVEWLAQHIEHRDLVVLDASYFMAGVDRNAKSEWFEARIPRSVFFDFDTEICAKNSDLPHMMPSALDFQNSVQSLGINQTSVIVVYDSLGIFSSPRVWWMLKAMGAESVAVLDGGLPAWISKSLPLEDGSITESVRRGDFVASYQRELFCDSQDVLLAIENEKKTIVDARSQARFTGQEAEAREGLRVGHIPNSKNLPFADILSEQVMLDAYQLATIFESIAPKNNGFIFSCGSGVTACILALGATLSGYKNISVYDGSWTEWGRGDDFPIVVS